MSYNPCARSTLELLADWAAIMRELRERDVLRTNNNPVSDIAEAIVAEHFDGVRASFSQAGWDVQAGALRIQVKGMRRTPHGKRSKLSAIRDSNYDVVVVVIFDENFLVTEGLQIPRDVVEERFGVVRHINGRAITLTKALLLDARVTRLDLVGAGERLCSRQSRS